MARHALCSALGAKLDSEKPSTFRKQHRSAYCARLIERHFLMPVLLHLKNAHRRKHPRRGSEMHRASALPALSTDRAKSIVVNKLAVTFRPCRGGRNPFSMGPPRF